MDTAADGFVALDKTLKNRYGLMLLDQMMPGLSGLDVLRMVRTSQSETDLPVIMVTALDQDEMIVEALECGANDYLVKPVEMPEVVARINAQLSRKRGLGEAAKPGSQGRQPLPGPSGAWLWDPQQETAQFSSDWKRILGYRPHEIEDMIESWLDRIHPDDLVRVRKQLKAHLEGPALEFSSEHRLRTKSGSYRWVSCRGVGIRSEDGRLLRMAGSITDIDRIKTTDPLTGLSNRAEIVEYLDAELALMEQPGYMAVLLINLDNFRHVNDYEGHAAGDHLLLEVTSRLKEMVSRLAPPEMACLGRTAGDEFVVVMNPLEHPSRAPEIARQVVEAIGQPINMDGKNLATSCSIGLVVPEKPRMRAEEVLMHADLALTDAKQNGKRRWVQYDRTVLERSDRRVRIEADFRHAVEREELVAVYQPKVDLRTRSISGFEALLRWNHPDLGLLPPNDFIPMAERTGLIIPAGEWILREACHQIRIWQEQFPQQPPLSISVNLSVRQLLDPQLPTKIRAILEETEIQPSTLNFELTETFLVDEISVAQEVLGEIHSMRIGLELDDFGTGYAGLSYLSKLPFDALKIDRSFVSRLHPESEARAIIRTIVALARELKLGLLAEGVETEHQIEQLLELGCEAGQGFYFSRPVTAEKATELLERSMRSLPLSGLLAEDVIAAREVQVKTEAETEAEPQPIPVGSETRNRPPFGNANTPAEPLHRKQAGSGGEPSQPPERKRVPDELRAISLGGGLFAGLLLVGFVRG